MYYLKFYNPPSALLASGSKKGVDLGGQKCIISIDKDHNLYNEAYVYTEMSWAEFYKDIEGLEDQIDTFTTTEFKSIREDPNALKTTIIETLHKIMEEKRLYYGIGDFEVDAFLNQNTVIPGLKLHPDLINTLMEAHKKSRNEDLFPKLIKGRDQAKSIKVTFTGTNKNRLLFPGDTLKDIADKLRMAKGFATGIIAASKNAANFFMMNDKIVFREEETPEFYIDENCITIIESGIERDKLFPISWFRFDLGVRSFETLELWDKIKEDNRLKNTLQKYDNYITNMIIDKYKDLATDKALGTDLEDFSKMTPWEKTRALRDMREAIEILTEKYEE